MPILLTEKSPQQTAWTRIIIQEAPRLSRRRHSAVASVIRLSIAVLSSGLFGDEHARFLELFQRPSKEVVRI
jgi:hypothetical protein